MRLARTLALVLIAGAVLGGGLSLYFGAQAERRAAEDRSRAAEAERATARERADEPGRPAEPPPAKQVAALQYLRELRVESRTLIPEALRGVELGMDLATLRRVRPRAEASTGRSDPRLAFHEELLENGAKVMYGFVQPLGILEQLQVLSLLPNVAAIEPHLAAMTASYGPPSGYWDCPDTEGVGTRRFTWRRDKSSLADIFLVVGERVSVTLYVAPTEIVQQSLERSGCRPVAREAIDRFPVADPSKLPTPRTTTHVVTP